MKLEQHLASAQLFFDHVGHCRISSFYYHHNKDRIVLVEMAARFVVGVFAVLSVYDIATRNLSFTAKVLVHGTVLCIISSLALSFLLKRIMPASDEKSDPAREKSETDGVVAAVLVEHGPVELPKKEEKRDDAVVEVKKRYLYPRSPVVQGSVSGRKKNFKKVQRNLMAEFERAERKDRGGNG